MLGLLAVLLTMAANGVWIFMIFSGRREPVSGYSYNTWMYLSIGTAILAYGLMRIGV